MVEIREIQPPRDVQDAMTRQMSAERNRRATVTEADGKREAAIKVAEGEKQAAILTAEGYALALEKIEAAANGIGSKTMSLQYLDALRTVGAGPATKFVLPMEFTALLRPLVAHVERAGGAKADSVVSRGIVAMPLLWGGCCDKVHPLRGILCSSLFALPLPGCVALAQSA